MKAIIKSKDIPSKPFPKLMISEHGTLVLFESDEVGTIIYPGINNTYKIGDYIDDWVMSLFKDFDGEVTLSND